MNNILFLFCLFINELLAVVPKRWICLGQEVGSCYLKYKSNNPISFDAAQDFCRRQNATLAMFPAFEEMEIIHQLITIETKYNLNNEQDTTPHYYWVGLKFGDAYYSTQTNHSLFWVNATNDKTIAADRWKPRMKFNLSSPRLTGSGCVAAEIYMQARYVVNTRLRQKASCDISENVKNALCEKSNSTSSDSCELEGLAFEEQRRACCETPPQTIPFGNVIKEYTGTLYNDIASYFCHTGFKDTQKKRSSITLRCGQDEQWIGLDFDPTAKAVCEPLSDIPLEWKYYAANDHCYQLNHSAVSWEEARQKCAGGLLTLSSQEELNFLKANIFEPQAERSIVWTGGLKSASEDAFTWRLETGHASPISGYSNWHPSRTPLTGPYHKKLCIAANYSDAQWYWLNVSCDSKLEYVCKTQQQKLHGQWNTWTEWTACDRNYMRQRERTCNNPAPFCGGDNCTGFSQDESYCCVDPGIEPFSQIAYKSITNTTVFLLPGHYYTYQCLLGYEHVDGNEYKNITCLTNGSWTEPGAAPVCIPKLCPVPLSLIIPSPSEMTGLPGLYRDDGLGIIKDTSRQIEKIKKDLCKIFKNHGLRITIDANRKSVNYLDITLHLNNGNYKPFNKPNNLPIYVSSKSNHPRNIIKNLPAENGSHSYVTESSLASKYGHGSRISYDCAYGFGTTKDNNPGIGSQTDCVNGNWQDPPLQCFARCMVLDFMTAHFECNDGYRVDTGNVNEQRVLLTYTFTCSANNDWTDDYSPRQCVKQTCGDPGNGTNVESRIGKSFLYQDIVDYVCKQGYIFNNSIGRRRLVCDLWRGSQYVSWNGTELICDKVVCGDPGNGSSITREGNAFDYGGVLIYTCNKQHVLIGGGVETLLLRCGTGGKWNGSAPSCEPAEMSSDFAVFYVKPFSVTAQWIMSEKYKGVPTHFTIYYIGRPGYRSADSNFVYLSNDTSYAESAVAEEGYNDLYPNELFTYKELEIFTKYETWPAYFATPLCNPFSLSSLCWNAGKKPSDAVVFYEENFTTMSDPPDWRETLYSSNGSYTDSVTFVVGSDRACAQYNDSPVCNGPLRANRYFCVKLRAYTKYGWNDSMCSAVIQLHKVLEFDNALVVPTVLATLPFIAFITLGVYLKCRKTSMVDGEDEDANEEIVKTWSLDKVMSSYGMYCLQLLHNVAKLLDISKIMLMSMVDYEYLLR
ncbi:uncharacterized protein [Watersipora subatra]|uniref:uncharacterized protein n=1 Tax=Watersipora subatra TaxID=2589382 RepID=UPI00355C73BD